MRSLRGENVDYLESFKSDEVDAKLFKEAFMKKFDKIVEAKFDYIDIIYSILDKEQKRKPRNVEKRLKKKQKTKDEKKYYLLF